MKFNVRNLFPIPLFELIFDEDLFKDEVDLIISKIQEDGVLHVNEKNLASEDSFILDEWNLPKIKQCIESSLKHFADDVLQYEYEKLYITQSWVNVNLPGSSHHYHKHPNSILSGILYLNTGDECGDIVFHQPEGYGIDLKPKIKFDENNILTWETVKFAPKDNQLFIFPSNLYHSVSTNLNENVDRVSLSFNTFVSPLGSKEHKTYVSMINT